MTAYTPKALDYTNVFSQSPYPSSLTANAVMASAILPGADWRNDRNASTTTSIPGGLLAVMAVTNDLPTTFKTIIFLYKNPNVSTDRAAFTISNFSTMTSGLNALLGSAAEWEKASIYSGIVGLQRGQQGLVCWTSTPDELQCDIHVVRAGNVIILGTNYYYTDYTLQSLIATLTDSKIVCDICPVSRSQAMLLLVGKGKTASSTKQLQCVQINPDNKLQVASSTDGASEVWGREYIAATYSGPKFGNANTVTWSARPDTVLAVQNMITPLSHNTIALLGTWLASPTIHKGISSPRLAIISTSDGSVVLTNTPGSGSAHNMVVNQFGEIYVCGTQSLTSSTANLIERYQHYDLSLPDKYVTHAGAGTGLGGGYASSVNTHVHDLIWTGSHLIAIDHDASQTRMFIYDRDLTQIGSPVQISTTSVTAGTRFRGGKYCTPWWSENY